MDEIDQSSSNGMIDLQRKIRAFWDRQIQDIEQLTEKDFKNHKLPLARIKKIMKSDEDVRVSFRILPLFLRIDLNYR